jgi:secreted PhoX family phosphatase
MDGMGAWSWSENTVRLFVNHELDCYEGYRWKLANGTTMRGARISWFDIDKQSQTILNAGDAIKEIRDRRGEIVTHAAQVSEIRDRSLLDKWKGKDEDGLNNLCSAQAYKVGEFGFVNDLLFTHEEVSALDNHPHGGSVWALDVHTGTLWALPELGRGAWENVAAVETPDQDEEDGHIALLIADDFDAGAAPLYLWIGRKLPGGNLIERNGLAQGQLYAWASLDGDHNPEDWNGTGTERAGVFKPLTTQQPDKADQPGYDQDGYLNDPLLRAQAKAAGAFMMSRPEDLHTNPANGLQVALCSTGQGNIFPSDDWGTVYLIEMQFDLKQADPDNGQLQPSANIKILHDADDFGDHGIRSPDNIVWAHDGKLYIHEDKATKLNKFGGETGRESSTWCIDPLKPDDFTLIATIDRSVVLPPDASDKRAQAIGAWECCGLIDVSDLFTNAAVELWFITAVQAHSIRGGSLGGRDDLVQGGQLVLLKRAGIHPTE